jgi:hypothetical protein
MNPVHEDLDLAWLAFQYVAGELTRPEHEAFEQRLDHDQSAREAVAQAVALVEALGTRPAPIRFPIRRVAAVLAMAACLLVGVGFWFRPTSQPRSDSPGTSAPDSVAQTWSNLRQDAEADRHESLAWLDETSGDADAEEEADADLGVPPGWLLDAASLPNSSPAASPGF